MTYSIADLEQLSGVHSHTIRIWEQRYNALSPLRSQGNTRLYDDQQLVKLLNIVTLNKSGLKISKICSLSDEQIDELLDQQFSRPADDKQDDYYVSQLIKYGLAFDESSFNHLIDQCIHQFGLSDCYRKIIYPLLLRLGLMWRKDDICPAHEHFLSNIIRQKIFSHINNLPLIKQSGQRWLLFLPEDEDHDIGLLFANYMLRMQGHQVIFLGSKVPLDSISRIFSTLNVGHVLLFMIKSQLASVAQQYIDQLSEICSATKIHLAGNSEVIGKLNHIDHINWIKTLDEFEKTIEYPVLHERNF
ncbi:MerR family transcriptional regulator [Pedobacter sp. MR2016-19]|uniref:MerR family transcriptional regulator n=1 Tax=Pedobacter sp. MR2016-19 TaxID=2780089 RepID=UPI0018754EF2|nr:MerR family transcriptional regulator [Pedobacter sp. MR2016-19]MBE5321449.1 MerR family transcriptional regulator [Pedobacter sp. MR2016-19]